MSTRQFRILTILTVMAGFLGGGVAVLLLQGCKTHAQDRTAGVQQRVTAREFVLVDAEGNQRMLLAVNEHNVAVLHMLDAKGADKLVLGVLNDGTSGLAVSDSARNVRLVLGLHENDTPVLVMFDSAEKPRLGVGVADDGAPGLTTYDPAGNVTWSAP